MSIFAKSAKKHHDSGYRGDATSSKPKKSLGAVLTEDVTTLKKTNVKLKKDNEALEKRIIRLEKTMGGLLQNNKHVISLCNRLKNDVVQCDTELQILRRAFKT